MRTTLLAAAIAAALPAAAFAITTRTVSFQNGINGYAGTTDLRIGEAVGTVAAVSQPGSSVTQYYVDGRNVDATTSTYEPDTQGLIRFDNIIGGAAAQIPAGAYILNANLTLTTGTATAASSGSRIGIARLLQPFTSTSTYAQFGSNGPAYLDGSADRTTGWLESNVAVNEQRSIRATDIVQAWSNGSANHGLAVQFGVQTNGADAWQIRTTGNATAANRPALNVTYVEQPVTVAKFRQGVNGYAGTTMAHLQGGTAYTGDFDDLTTDGNFIEQAFLDGPNAAGDSPNDQMLIKFDNLFARNGGTVPDGAQIVEAYLTVATGDGGNSPSGSAWDARPVLVDWDTSKTFTSFGGNGPDEAQGELGGLLDSEVRMLAGSQARYDLSNLVRQWQAGTANNGLNIQSTGSDGWQIHFSGSSVLEARPELTIAYVVPEPTTLAAVASLALLARRRRA